jgi:hypothetical protein
MVMSYNMKILQSNVIIIAIFRLIVSKKYVCEFYGETPH